MITEKINELNKIYPHHAETKQQIRALQAIKRDPSNTTN